MLVFTVTNSYDLIIIFIKKSDCQKYTGEHLHLRLLHITHLISHSALVGKL